MAMSGGDDGLRADRGVVARMVDLDDGYSRIVFDDVVKEPVGGGQGWRSHAFFTANVFPNEKLDAAMLSDHQYRDIGFALVTRLLAANGRTSK